MKKNNFNLQYKHNNNNKTNIIDDQADLISFNDFDDIFEKKTDIFEQVEIVLKDLIKDKTIIDDNNRVLIYNNIKKIVKKDEEEIKEKRKLYDEIKHSELNEIDEYEFNNLSDANRIRYIKLNILRKKNELKRFHRENLF